MATEKIAHNPNELLDILDDDKDVIGSASRAEIHEKGFLHREVYLYLICQERYVLLARRADNGLWGPSAAGHVPSGQSYELTACNESIEEIGHQINKSGLVELVKLKLIGGSNNRIAKVFRADEKELVNDFTIDEDEVKDVAYYDKKQLLDMVCREGQLTRSTRYILERYVIPSLKV